MAPILSAEKVDLYVLYTQIKKPLSLPATVTMASILRDTDFHETLA